MVVVCHLSDLQWTDRLMLSHRYCYHFHEQNFARNREKQFVSGTSKVMSFTKEQLQFLQNHNLWWNWARALAFIWGTLYLIGGFNPFEKYQSKWGSSPNRDEQKNIWKHHLDTFTYFYSVSFMSRTISQPPIASATPRFGTSAWSTAGRALGPSSWMISKTPNPTACQTNTMGPWVFFAA